MTVIDIHNHIVPDGFPLAPSSHECARWPSLRHDEGDKATIMIDGEAFRPIDSRSWDVARRVADLDDNRIDLQVVSPMPELLSYWFEAEDAVPMCRWINRAISEMVDAGAGRLAGFGMVPLQDPQAAASELTVLRDEFGLWGVEIGSNINGRPPGDPFLEPFFAEAERLGMPVFVHALHPSVTDRLVGPRAVQALVGFPTEIGLAAASVITGGLIERHPELRMAFSHGAGTLAAILPRLDHGWRINPAFKDFALSPFDAARRCYYDSLVFDVTLLHHLIDRFGGDRIMMGTDYPYTMSQAQPVEFIEKLGLEPERFEALAGGNAKRFLGIEQSG